MYTARVPYEGVPYGRVYYMVTSEKHRPELPEGCSEAYSSLVARCWAEDPDDRWVGLARARHCQLCNPVLATWSKCELVEANLLAHHSTNSVSIGAAKSQLALANLLLKGTCDCVLVSVKGACLVGICNTGVASGGHMQHVVDVVAVMQSCLDMPAFLLQSC